MRPGTLSNDTMAESAAVKYVFRINKFCSALGIGRSTYYKLLAEGKLEPALKLSKRARGYTHDYLLQVIREMQA